MTALVLLVHWPDTRRKDVCCGFHDKEVVTVGMLPTKGCVSNRVNTGIGVVGFTETETVGSACLALVGNVGISFDEAEDTVVGFSFTLKSDALYGFLVSCKEGSKYPTNGFPTPNFHFVNLEWDCCLSWPPSQLLVTSFSFLPLLDWFLSFVQLLSISLAPVHTSRKHPVVTVISVQNGDSIIKNKHILLSCDQTQRAQDCKGCTMPGSPSHCRDGDEVEVVRVSAQMPSFLRWVSTKKETHCLYWILLAMNKIRKYITNWRFWTVTKIFLNLSTKQMMNLSNICETNFNYSHQTKLNLQCEARKTHSARSNR